MKGLSTTLLLCLSIAPLYAFAKWPCGSKPFGSATLLPRSGTQVRGIVQFATKGEDLVVNLNISNAQPGKHGLHVHENGSCGGPNAEDAGGHYNPTREKHGAPTEPNRHLGDLGNIEVNADGQLNSTFVIENRDKNPFRWKDIVGKALVLHGGKDDLESQPSGGAGERVACGLIRYASTFGE